jgi:hypothetical protein
MYLDKKLNANRLHKCKRMKETPTFQCGKIKQITFYELF